MKRRIYRDLEDYFRNSGESQESFAARLGLSQGYISLLRNRKRTPSGALMKRIADAARIPMDSLISELDSV